MTWYIKTSLPVEFKISRVPNVLSLAHIEGNRKIVIIDRLVYELYKDALPTDVVMLQVDCSEATKTWNIANRILIFFEEHCILRRSEPVIAIGGGVLLDMVGFCCSVYRRGIPYIRIPTTLLAIVDASVGAKTSINHFDRRNRIGSFYTPVATYIDQTFIKTQTSREISNGIAEIVKLAIVTDRKLFKMLEINPQQLIEQKFQNNDLADQIIDRAIAGMTSQLNNNLWEKELKRTVDFGHSFSPLIEMRNIPNLLHGEAVILDCLFSSFIAEARGLISSDDLFRIRNLIKDFNLPVFHKDFADPSLLLAGLTDVVNHRNNNQYLPLPFAIGDCSIVNDVSLEEIQQAAKQMNHPI